MQGFLQFLVAVLSLAFAFWIIRRSRARSLAAAELKARREALWLRRLAQQRRVRERMHTLNEESLTLLEAMPGWLESAERHLDQAQVDFGEGAFAPFWISVERAALSLAAFDDSVQRLESNSEEYAALLPECGGAVVAFAVSGLAATRMTVATATSHRMHGIVRRAQRDFQFSVIYEQRKTNQILVAGFRSLAQAVEEMASRITDSLDSLTTSIERMTSTLDESLRRVTEQTEGLAVGAAVAGGHDEASFSREQKVLEVLDRIERMRYRRAIQGT